MIEFMDGLRDEEGTEPKSYTKIQMMKGAMFKIYKLDTQKKRAAAHQVHLTRLAHQSVQHTILECVLNRPAVEAFKRNVHQQKIRQIYEFSGF